MSTFSDLQANRRRRAIATAEQSATHEVIRVRKDGTLGAAHRDWPSGVTKFEIEHAKRVVANLEALNPDTKWVVRALAREIAN